MENLSNYSRRQQKRIKRYLNGQQPAMRVVIVCWVLLALIMMCYDFAMFSAGREDEEFPVYVVVSMLFLIFLVIYGRWILKYFKIKKIVKAYYENQPDWCRQEMIACASNYQTLHGILYSQNYIYGMMPVGIGLKEQQFRVMEFLCLPYSQLLWVYKNDRDIAIQTDFMKFSNYLRGKQDGRIKIYDIYGYEYNVPMRNMDYMRVFETIHRMNPNCLIGYNQGNVERMKHWKEQASHQR